MSPLGLNLFPADCFMILIFMILTILKIVRGTHIIIDLLQANETVAVADMLASGFV